MRYGRSISLLLMFALGAAAQDDACAVQREGLHAYLEARSPQLRGYHAHDARNGPLRQVIETARLIDGTRVQFTTGGCDHIIYTATYWVTPASRTDARVLAQQTMQLLGRTPLVEQHGVRVWGASLQRALQVQPPLSMVAGAVDLPCGDATCRIATTETTLTVSYDFAL